MPPPNETPAYHLILHPQTLFVFQINPKTPIPASLLQPLDLATTPDTPRFKSITWTHEEISIVSSQSPSEFPELKAGTKDSLVLSGSEDWECAAFSIRGPMELSAYKVIYTDHLRH